MCILFVYDTHSGGSKMRTNIVIDDSLMNKAKKVSGYKTKKETIEEALRLLVAQREQSEIRKVRGKLNWEGNLEEMRLDR
jgi:Arc/MetJ family transcription regulator